MKRTVHVLLISLLVILSSCADEKLIDEPQEIGGQLFELVKNAQSTSEDDYLKYFVDFETFHDLRSKNIKEELAANLDKEDKAYIDKYFNSLKRIYYTIKTNAIKEGIHLNEIEYVDFIHEPFWVDEVEWLDGTLYFTYRDDSYSIEGEAIKFGENYFLINTGEIKKI